MSWIVGTTQRYNTKNDLMNEWDDVYGQLPERTADCNHFLCLSDKPFATEDEAKKYIEKADFTGFGYVSVVIGKKSAKLRSAEELLRKEQEKLKSFLVKSSVYNTHKGVTVGCKRCGSSFPVAYFKKESYCNPLDSFYIYNDFERGIYINSCPICGAGMRSETAQKRIRGYNENIQKYETRVEELKKAEKSRMFYLGKVRAYTG